MKRFILMILVALLVVPLAIASTPPDYTDDRNYENFVGRLYIDDINVDVALYNSNKQEVVDRDDSAAYFGWSGYTLIGDHNTEAFAPLGTVKVGTITRIVREDGTIVYYECTDVFKGHNTGYRITDWDGNKVTAKADILMYTCFNGPRNIWVTLWRETLSPEEKKKQAALNNYCAVMDEYIDEMLLSMENESPCDDYVDEEIELTLQ